MEREVRLGRRLSWRVKQRKRYTVLYIYKRAGRHTRVSPRLFPDWTLLCSRLAVSLLHEDMRRLGNGKKLRYFSIALVLQYLCFTKICGGSAMEKSCAIFPLHSPCSIFAPTKQRYGRKHRIDDTLSRGAHPYGSHRPARRGTKGTENGRTVRRDTRSGNPRACRRGQRTPGASRRNHSQRRQAAPRTAVRRRSMA